MLAVDGDDAGRVIGRRGRGLRVIRDDGRVLGKTVAVRFSGRVG
jgi:hypothetical protein